MDKQTEMALTYALAFLKDIELELDEDSCMGMAFVTNRVCEDSYYMVINKIEGALAKLEQKGSE